jgi:hypothetical protein
MSSNGAATASSSSVTIDSLPPRWQPSPTVPRLPIGVAVLSVLIAVVALVMILGGLLYLIAELGGSYFPSALDLFPSIDLLGAAILLILGLCMIAVATALWRQETWALWTTLIVVFGATVYEFFTGSINILFLVFVVLFVYLLCVRRYFY